MNLLLLAFAIRRWVGTPTPREGQRMQWVRAVSYTHLRAHETVLDLVCRLLLEKKKTIKLNVSTSIILTPTFS